jgi:hypothetical protein
MGKNPFVTKDLANVATSGKTLKEGINKKQKDAAIY